MVSGRHHVLVFILPNTVRVCSWNSLANKGEIIFCSKKSIIIFNQSQNEQLLVKIASFDWYKLSTKNKKMILMFLKASQTYTDLSAILFPLNIGSYVQVRVKICNGKDKWLSIFYQQIHKKVYSMFMLLVNVKEWDEILFRNYQNYIKSKVRCDNQLHNHVVFTMLRVTCCLYKFETNRLFNCLNPTSLKL